MNFSVRLAEARDVPLLTDVEKSAATAFKILPDYKPSDRVVALALLNQMAESGLLWVACVGEKIVGFAGCENMGDCLYVHEISVAFDFQKHGIGRKIMSTIINAAKAKQYRAVGLTTNASCSLEYAFL